jgi:hypothetical protein
MITSLGPDPSVPYFSSRLPSMVVRSLLKQLCLVFPSKWVNGTRPFP